MLLNATPVPDDLVGVYAASGARLVSPDVELLRALGHRPVLRDLLGTGPKIRHDARKLAGAVLDLIGEPRAPARTS